MKKNTYGQYCPMSYALDVIGDRWTLHIVRDLGYGPRRFTDLLNGLPGLATNLLAKRLKEMEQACLITKKKLPPPSASTVYELTEHGKSLQKVNVALSNWGMHYLQVPAPEDDYLGIVPAMSSLFKFYDREYAANTHVTCEFHARDEVFTATFDNGRLSVSFGMSDNPDVVLDLLELKTLVGLINHVITIEDAQNVLHIRVIRGDISALQTFVDAYPAWVSDVSKNRQ